MRINEKRKRDWGRKEEEARTRKAEKQKRTYKISIAREEDSLKEK